MTTEEQLSKLEEKVIKLRDEDVLLDAHLAKILGTTTSNLLQVVSKNKDRFPKDFSFPVKKKELQGLVEDGHLTKKQAKNRTKPPLVFTEPGAYMVALLLKSKPAQKLTVAVLRTFLEKEQQAA